MATKYAVPWQSGLASTNREVAKRLGAMLSAMSLVNDQSLHRGELTEEVDQLRQKVIGKLRDEGWRITTKGAYGYKVLPPKGGT